MMKDPDFDAPQEETKRFPIVKTCLGCSVLTFIVLALLCGGSAYWMYQKVHRFSNKYEEIGYEPKSGQMVVVTEPIETPHVYTAQLLSIKSDVDADLAVCAQQLEIQGTVHGDIDFWGQLLIVKPSGTVDGDIRAEFAQVIDIQGTVTGTISGDYQVLNRKETDTVGDDAGAHDVNASPDPTDEFDEEKPDG